MIEFREMNAKQKELILNVIKKEIERTSYEYQLKDIINKFGEAISELLQSEYKKSLISAIKKAYKEVSYDERLFFDTHEQLVNQSLQMDESGENWTYWYLIKGEKVCDIESFINKYGYKHGIYTESDEIHSAYDCTGQTFSYDMRIKKVADGLFLCTKRYGLDV